MVGQNIGKYQVLERVGRGGMGTVYRAMDETLHREVAIKVLNAELNDPEVSKRFRAEAITVARLSHPGIATIYELFQHEGQWLMVMEFVRGETIEHMVERMGALSPQRAAELCMQALAALAHAHSMGVVHRDLKPANIMITETGAIKIMDFGIARVAGTEHLTNAGFMMGTPSYMAPEQVMGREIDARADLYAMGVVFYRLTSAKLPFKGDTPFAMAQSQVNDPPMPIGQFRADLPPWVEQVVVRSLAKSPEERFQSAVEFHEAFARCLAGLPMTSLYSSSAPTEMMMTPPRAMPTGSLRTIASMQIPVPHTPTPQPMAPAEGTPAAQPAAGTPVSTAMPAPGTPVRTPVAPLSDEFAQTIPVKTPTRTPTAAVPQVSPTDTGAAPVAVAAAATAATVVAAGTPAGPQATKAAPAKKQGAGAMVGVLAAVVVFAAIGGAIWYRHHQAQVAVQAAVAAAAAAAAAPPPAPVADAMTPPVAPVSAPANQPAVSAAAAPTASAASSAKPATPAVAGSTTAASTTDARGGASTTGTTTAAGATPAAGGRAAAPGGTPATGASKTAPVDDTHQAFTDVKVLVVNGRKTNDEDVVLSFVGGQITVLAKKDLTLSFADGHLAEAKGETSSGASLPYKSIQHATYVHARDPKWNASAAVSPPDDLDVGGMLRTAKQWLVLQTKDSYLILRLDDSNVTRILQTVEARTGQTIDRPQQSPADKQ